MAKTKRLFKSLYRLILPVFILLFAAVVAASIWLVHTASIPPQAAYLVTPEKYGQFSARGARVTEETWTNPDNTQSRGWLLRGAENAPAVILLHRYGADRSYVLNLGVKLNEATDFTVLMPDERGHGANPAVKSTTFGGCETDDALTAIRFLRDLKTANQTPLVGKNIGFYGVETGALAALSAAAKDESVKALALDSVPSDSDAVIASATDSRFPFASSQTAKLAQLGTYFYFYNGCYRRNSACDVAKSISNRQVLLLAGKDAPGFQSSTAKLERCFSGETKVEAKNDLNPSGYGITSASLEQSSAYEQRVIEFFKQNL
jgi:pimeloyl-ACP methyl ester carboxylesterase